MKQFFLLLFFLVYFLGGLECIGYSLCRPFSMKRCLDSILVYVLPHFCISCYTKLKKKNGRLFLVYCILTINIKIKIFYANVAIAFFSILSTNAPLQSSINRHCSRASFPFALLHIFQPLLCPVTALHLCFLDSAVPFSIFIFVFSNDFVRSSHPFFSLRASNL
jgi:hypothetical protein